jgi:FG-GAP-like repeat
MKYLQILIFALVVFSCTSSLPDEKELVNKTWFRHHFIQQKLEADAWGQTAFCDIDRDGDLDFVTGRRAGVIVWFEFIEPDSWRRHMIAQKSPSDVGGVMLDVDSDGWPDMVAGGSWYRNPGGALDSLWVEQVFDPGLRFVHDIVTADLDSDGVAEIVTMGGEMQGITRSQVKNLRYYRIAANPRDPWEKTVVGESVHSGLAAADMDLDGDIDLLRSDIWLENDGAGRGWAAHRIVDAAAWDPASQTAVSDIDRDGRPDVVLAEGEISGARIAWFRSADDPKAGPWQMHLLEQGDSTARGPYHSLAVEDFDNDGDPDIFAGEMEWLGEPPYRWFIWENDGGRNPKFTERVILDNGLGTHNAVAGDVDGDGDMDIAGKLWRAREDNANGGSNHADFLENLTIP